MSKKVSDLKPNPKNPRKITDEKLEMLKRSLNAFGPLDGIVYNRRLDQLVGGHQRSKLFGEGDIQLITEFSEPTAKGTTAEGYVEIDGERHPYREVDWDENTHKAATAAANKGAGDWDRALLSELIIDLDHANYDLDLIMFNEEERENAVVPVQHVPPAGEDSGGGAPAKNPLTRPGDVFVMGRHRLVCGSATVPESWDAIKSQSGSPTLVFTSPPYGVGGKATLRQKYVAGKKNQQIDSLYANHQDNPDEWPELMRDWTAMAIAHAGCTVCNVQMLANNKRHLLKWAADFADHLTDVAIWDKGHGIPQMAANMMNTAYEWLFILSSSADATRALPFGNFHATESNMVRIGGAKNQEYAEIHKATMPVELAEWAIRVVGAKADHIIDPFGGTGTTLIAAEKAGKTCGLIELDPGYCDVIIKRFEDYTQEKAYLVLPSGDTVSWAELGSR